MDGNQRMEGSSQTSGMTRGNDLKVGPEEDRNMHSQMMESPTNEWTDEKHSLYLNSIEASFVKQLHNYEYRLMDSRTQKLLAPKSSTSNANSCLSSGQFKVLQYGFWQKLNFERARTQMDAGKESRGLLSNPWVKHFRSASTSKGLEVASPGQQEAGEGVIFGGWKDGTKNIILATSSKQHPSSCSSAHCRDSIGSNTEVSDQNFVDESCGCREAKQLSSTCKRKRVTTAVADGSSKDQVVPLGHPPNGSEPQ